MTKQYSMKATLKQTISMLIGYIEDEGFTKEDKDFFVEQVNLCLIKSLFLLFWLVLPPFTLSTLILLVVGS